MKLLHYTFFERYNCRSTLSHAMKRVFATMTFLFVSVAIADSLTPVPVIVGQDGATLDACSSIGELTEDSSLYAGPGSNFDKIISLAKQDRFYICGESKDKNWFSVVFAQDKSLDCQVSSPAPKPHMYAGPCIFGWVRIGHVEVIAS
jgi:hypothetical protein